MVKDIDKASELIKERRNRRSRKKSKYTFLNIEKSCNEIISIMEE